MYENRKLKTVKAKRRFKKHIDSNNFETRGDTFSSEDDFALDEMEKQSLFRRALYYAFRKTGVKDNPIKGNDKTSETNENDEHKSDAGVGDLTETDDDEQE